MLGINSHPVEFMNSLLRPWGLAISNKDQIIQKIVLVSVAALAISSALPTAEGVYRDNRVISFDGSAVRRQLEIAVGNCKRNCDFIEHSKYQSCIHGCNRYYGG